MTVIHDGVDAPSRRLLGLVDKTFEHRCIRRRSAESSGGRREPEARPGVAPWPPVARLLFGGLPICSVFACTAGFLGTSCSTGAAATGAGATERVGEELGLPPGEAAAPGEEDPGPRVGDQEENPADLIIGAILPVSGSPSLRRYARLLVEGLETGVVLARETGLRVELRVEDNQGTVSGSVRGASELVALGVLAILGPLDANNLRAAARAAPGEMAFFSPTARQVPYGRRGVYSMAAGDPEAGRTLARAVWKLGFANAVIVHPRSPGDDVEMDAFQRTFASLGGVVERRIRYRPGTTTFEQSLAEVKSLAPSLLVVAAPPADVELLAPQIAFFGLDETDLQVAGTAGWTAPSVIERVPHRHTDGVIALSTVPPGAVREPPPEFVAAYETLFRRSLNSPVPAVGLDLLRMALGAYGEGADEPAEVAAGLERVGSFEGATGTYSFAAGRLGRRYFPVRILQGALHPAGADPTPIPPSGDKVREAPPPAR
ncbi:MAG: ABC transporter substrate-binding protein [Gemmatimonadota bacterium]|nr:ABC transporter substrate-binding protein [Gemmatimonadota bacterium]